MLDQLGSFTYRDGIAVIQLVAFAIALPLAIVLCLRHGFRRSDGWVIMVTFSILRLLAASFQLASINYPTTSVYGGALICQGIGLAPLTLLNMGLFGRLNKFVNLLHTKLFTLISLLTIAGIALAIYGGTKSAESPTLATNPLVKASVLVFAASYLFFVCMFFTFLRQWQTIPQGERKLLLCFAGCAPFMVVRFLFAILGAWVVSLRPHFGVLTGNVTIFLCMAVIEEIIVVALFILTGLALERLPEEMRARPEEQQKTRNDIRLLSRGSA